MRKNLTTCFLVRNFFWRTRYFKFKYQKSWLGGGSPRIGRGDVFPPPPRMRPTADHQLGIVFDLSTNLSKGPIFSRPKFYVRRPFRLAAAGPAIKSGRSFMTAWAPFSNLQKIFCAHIGNYTLTFLPFLGFKKM